MYPVYYKTRKISTFASFVKFFEDTTIITKDNFQPLKRDRLQDFYKIVKSLTD